MDSPTTESQSHPVSSSDEQSAVTSPFPSHGQITNPSLYMDTTLTKVFVGGLAWQTKSSVLHEHFAQYGDILEAVVIMDRNTGRSKGFGFVTFAEKEAAERATQNPNPVIDNRKANCNLAFLGATKRPTGPGRRDYPPQYTMPTTIPVLHPYGYGYATHPTSGAETAHSVEGSESNPTTNGAGVVMMNPTSPYYSTYSSPYPQQTYSPYTVYQGGDYNQVYYGFSPQLYMSPSSVSSRPSYSPEQVPGPQYVYTSPPPYSTDMYASNGVPHMSTPQQHSINHNSNNNNNNNSNSGSVVYASAPSSVVGPPPLILPQSHPNAVPITGVTDSTRSDASATGVVSANPNPDASPALSSSSSASSAITTTTGASPTNSTTSDAPQQTPSGTSPQQQQQQQQQSVEKTAPTNGHVMSSTGAPQQQQSQGLRGTSPISPPHGYTAPSLPYGYTITTGTAVLMPFPQPGNTIPTVPATAHGHSTHMPQHAFYNPHHRSPPHVYQHRGGLRSTPSVQQTSSSHHPRGPINNNNMNGKPMYFSAPVSNSTQDALSQQFQQLSVAPKSE